MCKIPDIKHTYSSLKKISNTNDLMNVTGEETESFGAQGWDKEGDYMGH